MWQKVILIMVVLYTLTFKCSDGGTTEILPDDDSESSPLSQDCMRCLCKVMGCRKEGCVGKVCGLFHITQGYWEAAHYLSSNPANRQDYEHCTNNAWCASRTVQRHMRRYLPACELKRPERLRCENAVALHVFGSRRCDQNLTSAHRTKLFKCFGKYVTEWLVDEAGPN